MPIIGTAGHVDHGKSTLVRVLTNKDPDRLAEEKRRGLTIDLGFGWRTMPSGATVSFVDVPGHDRFIKNMLAGIEAIDAALFVVAADEGWMPQSEEHLAILDLLDVSNAVIALTKIDRVDADLAELAREEIVEHIASTSLQGAPILPVSAATGAGVEDLVAAIDGMVGGLPKPDPGPPRLWVDRVFTVPGAGTVVTGSLLSGSLSVGDTVVMWPGAHRGRIRGLQIHEKPVAMASPATRVAVNLQGIPTDAIERGAMISTGDHLAPTNRIAATIRTARYAEALRARGAYHLHMGSGVWPVAVRSHREEFTVLHVAEPLSVQMGDRFILRDTGRRLVVAGGRVLVPDPPRTSRLETMTHHLAATLDGSRDSMATALLELRRRASLADLAAHTGGGVPSRGSIVAATAYSATDERDLMTVLESLLVVYHRAYPLRTGMPTAHAAEQLGIPAAALRRFAADSERIVLHGEVCHLSSFDAGLDVAQEETWRRINELLAGGGATELPRVAELGVDEELLHALVRRGSLVRISNEYACLPEHIAEFRAILGDLGDPFSIGEFKERSGWSRKYALLYLDWADRTGVTVRMGDLRRMPGSPSPVVPTSAGGSG